MAVSRIQMGMPAPEFLSFLQCLFLFWCLNIILGHLDPSSDDLFSVNTKYFPFFLLCPLSLPILSLFHVLSSLHTIILLSFSSSSSNLYSVHQVQAPPVVIQLLPYFSSPYVFYHCLQGLSAQFTVFVFSWKAFHPVGRMYQACTIGQTGKRFV